MGRQVAVALIVRKDDDHIGTRVIARRGWYASHKGCKKDQSPESVLAKRLDRFGDVHSEISNFCPILVALRSQEPFDRPRACRTVPERDRSGIRGAGRDRDPC